MGGPEAVTFIPGVAIPDDPSRPTAWFAFRDDQLLVRVDGESASLISWSDAAELGATPDARHYLGRLGDVDCFAIELDARCSPPASMAFEGLRALFGRLADDHFSVAGRAVQIVAWDRTHRFCGRCGQPTERLPGERARRCPACGLLSFPRLSPAVITLVERGEELLLARSPHFAPGVYSALAGFVEPGESLEEAVAREIHEEVGISVRDLRYFGSQPWPFPNSLMIGFTATHDGGEIRIDPTELEDAAWFPKHALPDLPSKMSIARRLIDASTGAR
jgi:NAD+ diphosphatase